MANSPKKKAASKKATAKKSTAKQQREPLVQFDPDNFTIGDLEDFEEATEGMSMWDLFKPGTDPADPDVVEIDFTKLTAKVIKAIAWIELRRSDPDLELDKVRDIRLGDIGFGSGADPS